jgi:hydrogenase/urease accessory protein HupE
MKRLSVGATVLIAAATPAVAHPGNHELSFVQTLSHILTQPDHIAIFAIAISAFAGLAWWRNRSA